MSKGESVTSGLAINAVGVGMILVGFQPWWGGVIATVGAVIALIALFQPDPVVSNTRKRLRRLATVALEMAAAAKTDDEFGWFHEKWWSETVALRDFVQAQYGLRARGFSMDHPTHLRIDAAEFASAVNELADRIG